MTKIRTVPILLLALSFFCMQPLMASIYSPVMVVGDDFNDRPILTASNDDGRSWKVFRPDAAKGKFTTTHCSGATCIAAGQPGNLDQPNIPLLYFSNDRGSNWSLVNLPNAPQLTIFLQAGCTGEETGAICFAAGIGYPNGSIKAKIHVPVLVVTTDNGKTWVIPKLTIAGTQGTLESGSCTGSGADAVCVMVGQYTADNIVKPLIIVSKDGGKNWSQNIVPGLPNNIYLNKVSCTSSGNNATCAAIGHQWHETNTSIILDSKDSGTTWELKTVLGEDSAELKDVSCAGTGSNTVCAVAGYRYDTLGRTSNATSAMIATLEGSHYWISKLDDNLRFTGEFTAIACDSNGNSTPICIALGDTPHAAYALFASTDAGRTWSQQTLPPLSTWTDRLDMHSLDNLSCSNMKPNFNCMVTGMGYHSLMGIQNKNPIRAVAFTSESIIQSGEWQMSDIWG